MRSQLFAIADAGGNIYPGTFSQTADRSISKRISLQLPGINYILVSDMERMWAEVVADGDHVVKCDIDTNETVAVSSTPWPPPKSVVL